jgi:hypothetical protein
MRGGWLTYREAAKRLGITAEAVRLRAIRKGWPRTRGEDGKARIQLPAGVRPLPPHRRPTRAAPIRASNEAAVVENLQSTIEMLKERNAAVEAQAAAADARLERQAADFAAREAQHAVEMAAERERADKALAELRAHERQLAWRFAPIRDGEW